TKQNRSANPFPVKWMVAAPRWESARQATCHASTLAYHLRPGQAWPVASALAAPAQSRQILRAIPLMPAIASNRPAAQRVRAQLRLQRAFLRRPSNPADYLARPVRRVVQPGQVLFLRQPADRLALASRPSSRVRHRPNLAAARRVQEQL